jgi:opacity protein-like surface antigen
MKLRDSLATAALAVLCLSAPAFAQANNNSNSSGTNNSNSSGTNNSNSSSTNNSNLTGVSGSPLSGSGGGPGSGNAGYNSSVLGQAQSLQQQLAAAQSAVDNFRPPADVAPSGPRSFARNPQPCDCAKPSGDGGAQERAQLEANLAKAKADAAAFLDSVRNPGPDKLGDVRSTGQRSGPTW